MPTRSRRFRRVRPDRQVTLELFFLGVVKFRTLDTHPSKQLRAALRIGVPEHVARHLTEQTRQTQGGGGVGSAELTAEEAQHLDSLIAGLTLSRASIMQAMVFCLDTAAASVQARDAQCQPNSAQARQNEHME